MMERSALYIYGRTWLLLTRSLINGHQRSFSFETCLIQVTYLSLTRSPLSRINVSYRLHKSLRAHKNDRVSLTGLSAICPFSCILYEFRQSVQSAGHQTTNQLMNKMICNRVCIRIMFKRSNSYLGIYLWDICNSVRLLELFE